MPGIGKSLPRALVAGARVGVVGLSGPVAERALAAGLDVLRARGFAPVLAPNLGARDGYVAGTDELRLAGLEALLDRRVDALVAARGGYGSIRLLSRIPWERLADWGGWVVGFSDLTAVHAAAAMRYPFVTLHAPMVSTLAWHPPSAAATFAWLGGRAPRVIFRFGRRQVLRSGVASGVAVGGSLSLLAALVGTPYEPDYRGAVLFIEDVNEPGYRLDRLLTQLGLSSRLVGVTAVVVGEMVRCGRAERGWRERWQERLEAVAPPGAVVVSGVGFGHGQRNRPIPLGAMVEVDTRERVITWGGL